MISASTSIPQSADAVRAEAHAAVIQFGRKPTVTATGRFTVGPAVFTTRRAA